MGSQGKHAGVTGLVGTKVRERDLHDPLKKGTERKMRPQQVIYYRAMGQTSRQDLEERRES